MAWMSQAMCRIAPRPRREPKAAGWSGPGWLRRVAINGMEGRPRPGINRGILLRGTRIATAAKQG